MNLDDQDISDLRKNGARVSGDFQQSPKPREDLLPKVIKLLESILEKRSEIKVEAPAVTVHPPTVNIEAPVTVEARAEVGKWKFTIERDFQGRMTEVIATAIK